MDLQSMRESKMAEINEITKYLPGFNCGACGYKRCDLFAEALLNKDVKLEDCPFLLRDRYKENYEKLKEILEVEGDIKKEQKYIGVIDGYEADFLLKPLPNECSCRETLLIMDKKELKVGDYIRYRPLGCPIPHFAKIIDEYHGLYIIHVVGPCHRITGEKIEYKDVGIAIVVAFEGIVEGKVPEVGKTVKFIPKHCMMQKVHSGVVVQVEGKRVYIEGIDLKVF
jgi:uncharacterized Fe-S cluster-containing protein